MLPSCLFQLNKTLNDVNEFIKYIDSVIDNYPNISSTRLVQALENLTFVRDNVDRNIMKMEKLRDILETSSGRKKMSPLWDFLSPVVLKRLTKTATDASLSDNFLGASSAQDLNDLQFFMKSCFRLTDRLILVKDKREMEVLGSCLSDQTQRKPAFVAYLNGIYFNLPAKDSLPRIVEYFLRPHQALSDYTGGRQETKYSNPSPRRKPFFDLSYLYYGFSFLQDAVDRAIIDQQTNAPVGDVAHRVGIWAQQFPSVCYQKDSFKTLVANFMPLLLVSSWIFTACYVVKNVVHEKETGVKEMTKMMGLSNFAHWIGWFIQSFSIASIPIVFLVILSNGKVGRVIAHASWGVVLLLLIMFVIATLTQSFLISVFFSRANLAAAVTAIIYFMLFMPYSFMFPNRETIPLWVKTFSCVISQCAFGWGCLVLSEWELEGSGAQWSNVAEPASISEDFTLSITFYMLTVDIIIHIILIWYIETVFPGEFGMPRPFYFPFQRSYWCGPSKESLVHADAYPADSISDKMEPAPKNLALGVQISDLKKVYKNGKVAVDGLTLNFYENQISSFLGHNGAGKTTTMSILTGLFPPTSGTAFIYGRDIRTDFDEIRRSLGYVPQHNVLFLKLTVEEQLEFYAGLKNVRKSDIKEEVKKVIEEVGLEKKAKVVADALSGGMKRKLSIAIAFLGGSKTVVLDEPTAGVDPYARRGIWELLLKYKKGWTIILSTHHMDEADVLGDRIAIIASGKLRCVGSSMFLKNRFGSGFRLTLVKKEKSDRGTNSKSKSKSTSNRSENYMCDVETVTTFVKSTVPKARLLEDVGTELVYNLPNDNPESLKVLFNQLEQRLTRLGITNYGVSDTTLEEVFLRIAGLETEEEFEKKHATCKCCVVLRRKMGAFPCCKKKKGDKLAESETPKSETADDETGKHPEIIMRKNDKWFMFRRRLCALLIKRWHHFKRNLKGAFAEIFAPVLLVGFFVLILALITHKEPGIRTTTAFAAHPMAVRVYGTEKKPNNIFFSVDKSTDNLTYEDAKRTNKSLEKEPGLGIRCMNKNPFQTNSGPIYKKYKKKMTCPHDAHPPTFPDGRSKEPEYNADGKCACDSDGVWLCDSNDLYRPQIGSRRLDTGDNWFDMTKRNITQWLMFTEKDKRYKRHRYGGFSLGEYNAKNISNSTINKNKNISEFLKNAYTRKNILVWFNNKAYASLPAYMNTISNALLRSRLREQRLKKNVHTYGILTWNYPMNLTVKGSSKNKFEKGVQIPPHEVFKTFIVILALSIVPASFLLFPIIERVNSGKHLQFVSGVSPILYWSSNFLWDIMKFMIPVILIMIIFLSTSSATTVMEDDAWTGNASLFFCTTLLFTLYGFSVISMMFPFSLVFSTPSLAFVCMSVANFGVGMITCFASVIVEGLSLDKPESHNLKATSKALNGVFLIFPQYSLGRGLLDLYIRHLKDHIKMAYLNEHEPSVWSFQYLGRQFLALFIQFCFFSFLLMFIEYRGFGIDKLCQSKKKGELKYKRKKKSGCCSGKKHCKGSESEQEKRVKEAEDKDVLVERRRIRTGKLNDATIRIDGLTKDYGLCEKFRAVDDLCVGINSGQCFGLLGVNGAGKTTTFKMITGKTAITYGDAYFNGKSVRKDIGAVCQDIGYTPQFDALNPLLSGREQLAFYARLRGVEEKDVKKVVNWAVEFMHLKAHASQTTQNYSGGNKRKLSTAIALIGNPAVVLLDEPSAGMDPKARRFLWNRIIDVVRDGRCVVLTSHNMEECETLCNRIGIMVNGKLKCLGGIQHLKSRFGEGYTLTLKVQMVEKDSVSRVEQFVESRFAGAVRVSEHGGVVEYKLPTRGFRLPDVFSAIQEARERLNLEDYSLCQTSLDQVFINFANQQKIAPPKVTSTISLQSTTPSTSSSLKKSAAVV